MADKIEFTYIGWSGKPVKDGKGNSDKVWAAFKIGDHYYACWGRRGKAVSFKDYGTGWSGEDAQDDVIRKKRKTYKEMDDEFLMFSMFPTFQEDVEKRFSYCILADKIK